MDKRVVFAVAGAGKTTHIINQLEENTKALIVTYTNNNLANLKKKIRIKFGYLPENIKVISYFSFVYSFCYRPFLALKLKTTGIYYEPNPNRRLRKTDEGYYVSPSRRLYSNRIALLVQEQELVAEVRSRLEKYYDYFVVDEVQDLSGNDFNLLTEIVKANVNVLLVGDFFQFTYATSSDGNVRVNLHNNFDNYKAEFTNCGLEVDEETLTKSWRCSPATCDFVTQKMQINIDSHNSQETSITELSDDDEINSIASDNSIVKLFYQNASKYELFSRNWGECKGEDDYIDVCVVLNPNTYTKFQGNTLDSLAPTTKNKLYVAITRARGNVYIVEQSKLDDYKLT